MTKYLIILLASVSCNLTFAQAINKTVQGNLLIKDNILFLAEKEIKPKIEGDFSLSIEKNISYKNGNAILLMNNSGGTACPVQYRWLLIFPDSIRQTPEFGSCSDLPKITTDGDRLVVSFPKYNSSPKSTVIFDGIKLTENGKTLK